MSGSAFIYCAGCGVEVGAPMPGGLGRQGHQQGCPSLPRATGAMPNATLGEVAALRERVGALEDQIAVLFRVIERHLAGHVAPRQPKGPSTDPDRPIPDQPAKRIVRETDAAEDPDWPGAALEAVRESKP